MLLYTRPTSCPLHYNQQSVHIGSTVGDISVNCGIHVLLTLFSLKWQPSPSPFPLPKANQFMLIISHVKQNLLNFHQVTGMQYSKICF